jgi:hypothetical protein
VSSVRHARAVAAQVRARRISEAPYGLVTLPPPRVEMALAGLDAGSPVAGVCPVRVVAAAREAAHSLAFDEDGGALRAVAPFARRSWGLPGLVRWPEERDGTDPSVGLPAPIEHADLGGPLPDAVVAPGGEYAAVCVRDGRTAALAIVRLEPRELVRWIAGARCAAWSADGTQIAIGGEWGVILAEARPERPPPA